MSENNVVKTNYGPVRGLLRKSVVGEEYLSFRGIPYGKPPIGELRFRDPQPAEKWTHILDATKPGPTAMGLDFVTMRLNEGCTEDCLTLNIYTKNTKPRKPLPVMLWIHGGGFRWGNSSESTYGPDYLLEKDVVFVSINYRLGALGFLSIPDPLLKVPGNAAMKDQAMAMRWVRENIRYFGGDSENITVFGESVGAICTHWHMVSDFSKGLFDKAIVQSGSSLADFSAVPLTVNWAERLALMLGWKPTDSSNSYFEYLQNVSAVDIVMVQDSILTPPEKKIHGNMIFSITLEPYESEQCFNRRDPLEFYENAWGNKIPLIIGADPPICGRGGRRGSEDVFYIENLFKNQNRPGQKFFLLLSAWVRAKAGSAPVLFKDPNIFENIFERLKCGKGTDKSRAIAEKIKKFYYGNDTPSIANIDTYIDIISDKNFLHGMHLAVKARAKDPESASTYCYRFNFETKTNFTIMKSVFAHPTIKGTCHAEDIEYLFKTSYSKPVVVNSAEHKTINRMVSCWTRFAATGNPNNEVIKPTEWKPIENGSLPPYKCLNIADEVTFIDFPEAKRMEFWDSLDYN